MLPDPVIFYYRSLESLGICYRLCPSLARIRTLFFNPLVVIANTHQTSSNVSTLVERLGGLQLALIQAASYKRETNTNITDYLQSYNTAWDDLMKDEARPDFVLREYGHHSVYTTWAISFECVKRKNGTAANFLQVWSCLDNRYIWYALFHNEKSSRVHWSSALLDWFKKTVADKINFRGAVQTSACLLID